MRTKTFLLIIFCIVLLAIITSCSSSSSNSKPVATSNADGATLVQERCKECHSLSRVEGKRYSAAEWTSIVGLMIEKGAKVTPAEEPVIVNYLAVKFGNEANSSPSIRNLSSAFSILKVSDKKLSGSELPFQQN